MKLTDEQIKDILVSIDPDTKRLPPGFRDFARAVIAAEHKRLLEMDISEFDHPDLIGGWKWQQIELERIKEWMAAAVLRYKADAERYQWIRDGGWAQVEGIAVRASSLTGFDADIDEAIRRGQA